MLVASAAGATWELDALPLPDRAAAVIDASVRSCFFQADVHDETDATRFRLRREAYDAATRCWLRALARAPPGLDAAEISWRMMFGMSSLLYRMAGVDRPDERSEGCFVAGAVNEMVEGLATFVVGGMSSPSTSLVKD